MRTTVAALLAAGMALAQDAGLLFSNRCSVCHGDGHGTERGPNLAGNRKVRTLSSADLRSLIRTGVPAAGMPAFDLPATELNALTGFVRALSAPASESGVAGDRIQGERFFFGKGNCGGCHLVKGRGKALGPDISAAGQEMTLDELKEAILRPQARIRPGYEMVRVRLRNGLSVRGFARNQSRFNLQLQDLNGRFHLLSQDEIAEVSTEPAR